MPDTSAFAQQSNSKSGFRKFPSRPGGPQSGQRSGRRSTSAGKPSATGKPKDADAPDEILFQSFFKSVGPRTYAAQIKKARNGNHYLVLTEGKRDKQTEELRKIRLFLYSEDFQSFFHLLRETADWIKTHPLPQAYQQKRTKFWAKKAREEPQRQASVQASAQTSAQTSIQASDEASNPSHPLTNPPYAARAQAIIKRQETPHQNPAPSQIALRQNAPRQSPPGQGQLRQSPRPSPQPQAAPRGQTQHRSANPQVTNRSVLPPPPEINHLTHQGNARA